MRKITAGFYILNEPLYVKGLSYYLLQLKYLKKDNYDNYILFINNPQCFNEVICESSLFHLSHKLSQHPENSNFDVCNKLWLTLLKIVTIINC